MKGGEHNEESKENKRSTLSVLIFWPVVCRARRACGEHDFPMKKVKKIKEAIGPCAVRGPYIPQK